MTVAIFGVVVFVAGLFCGVAIVRYTMSLTTDLATHIKEGTPLGKAQEETVWQTNTSQETPEEEEPDEIL